MAGRCWCVDCRALRPPNQLLPAGIRPQAFRSAPSEGAPPPAPSPTLARQPTPGTARPELRDLATSGGRAWGHGPDPEARRGAATACALVARGHVSLSKQCRVCSGGARAVAACKRRRTSGGAQAVAHKRQRASTGACVQARPHPLHVPAFRGSRLDPRNNPRNDTCVRAHARARVCTWCVFCLCVCVCVCVYVHARRSWWTSGFAMDVWAAIDAPLKACAPQRVRATALPACIRWTMAALLGSVGHGDSGSTLGAPTAMRVSWSMHAAEGHAQLLERATALLATRYTFGGSGRNHALDGATGIGDGDGGADLVRELCMATERMATERATAGQFPPWPASSASKGTATPAAPPLSPAIEEAMDRARQALLWLEHGARDLYLDDLVEDAAIWSVGQLGVAPTNGRAVEVFLRTCFHGTT